MPGIPAFHLVALVMYLRDSNLGIQPALLQVMYLRTALSTMNKYGRKTKEKPKSRNLSIIVVLTRRVTPHAAKIMMLLKN